MSPPLVLPHITLAGNGQDYVCEPGDTLLRAALRAGIGLAYECNAGACGSCKVDLIEGELEDLFPQASGLRPRDRERGKRLACQVVPRGDCTIKGRVAPDYKSRHLPLRRLAVLERVRDITHDIREFVLRAPGPGHFLPGQYAMLQLAGIGGPRAYSMSNTPNDEGLWHFMIRRTEAGVVSNALFALEPGARIELDGPYGLAWLREDGAREIVCVAGGSGIAPMAAILDAAAGGPHTRGRDAWFFFGGRGPRDIPAPGQVLRVARSTTSRLHWHPAVSVPEQASAAGWTGAVGFVHELLPRTLPQPLAEYEYYLAGPPPMIEATVRLLVADHKVPQTQLHFDRFF